MAKEKTAPEMIDDTLLSDADASEMRVYELGFHLDGELPQEEIKKLYQSVREGIAAAGTVISEGEPTKVPLAYTISIQNTTGRRDYNTAYFCWVAYETNGAGHESVQALSTANKSIIRFIDLRSSKEGAQHSADMHEIFANAALLEAQERQNEMDEDATHSEEVAPAREEEAVV
jgi:ribosomal protein S6